MMERGRAEVEREVVREVSCVREVSLQEGVGSI